MGPILLQVHCITPSASQHGHPYRPVQDTHRSTLGGSPQQVKVGALHPLKVAMVLRAILAAHFHGIALQGKV